MVRDRKLSNTSWELTHSMNLITDWLKTLPRFTGSNFKLSLLNYTTVVVNQMVRHGTRDPTPANLQILQAKAAMEIEYIELDAYVSKKNQKFRTQARIQNEKKHPENLRLNYDPRIWDS